MGDPGDAIPPIGASASPVEDEELEALAAQLTALAPRLTQAQRTRLTTIYPSCAHTGDVRCMYACMQTYQCRKSYGCL